tara:strand:- start:481 stop:654 length:174 start_codon:yes stop_codon:yes gene_type:complete
MEYLLIVWKEAESAEPTLTKSKLADSRKVVIRKDFAQYPSIGRFKDKELRKMSTQVL